MQAPGEKEAAGSSRAPRLGLRLMMVIFVGTALVAVYANVQKARRDKIEKVTIVPVSISPSASPSPGDRGAH